MLSETTSPTYLSFLGAHFVCNVLCLVFLNAWKKCSEPPGTVRKLSLSWGTKQLVYYAYFILAWAIGAYMDATFDVTAAWVTARIFVHIFGLGLLDYSFADTPYLSPRCIPGCAVYCGAVLLSQTLVELVLPGTVPMIIVSKFDLPTLASELSRHVVVMAVVALLIDLIFSPLHRLTHTPAFEKIHRRHHEAKHSLTSLLLFVANELDDGVMAGSVFLGFSIFVLCLAAPLVMVNQCWSNLTLQAFWYGTMFSHTHDVRCARLLVPFLPDFLNFAEYHRTHHESPTCNFGLTYPSDLLWDWILGKSTIRLEKLNEARQDANKERKD